MKQRKCVLYCLLLENLVTILVIIENESVVLVMILVAFVFLDCMVRRNVDLYGLNVLFTAFC